jgi:hypothetical protein
MYIPCVDETIRAAAMRREGSFRFNLGWYCLVVNHF